MHLQKTDCFITPSQECLLCPLPLEKVLGSTAYVSQGRNRVGRNPVAVGSCSHPTRKGSGSSAHKAQHWQPTRNGAGLRRPCRRWPLRKALLLCWGNLEKCWEESAPSSLTQHGHKYYIFHQLWSLKPAYRIFFSQQMAGSSDTVCRSCSHLSLVLTHSVHSQHTQYWEERRRCSAECCEHSKLSSELLQQKTPALKPWL